MMDILKITVGQLKNSKEAEAEVTSNKELNDFIESTFGVIGTDKNMTVFDAYVMHQSFPNIKIEIKSLQEARAFLTIRENSNNSNAFKYATIEKHGLLKANELLEEEEL